jgi:very-short-patch-repair endonuclease
MSAAEVEFALLLRAHGLPKPQREYRFCPRRKWRFDFAWPRCRVAVEIEGGIWAHGRHTRGKGYEADLEKYNAAALGGWRVLRFTPAMVQNGVAMAALKPALNHG